MGSLKIRALSRRLAVVTPTPDGVRRILRCACILLPLFTSGCVYFSKHTLRGACTDDLGSPIRNFCVVTPNILWRGERPTTADAQWLIHHGVGSVVSLQLDDRHAFESVTVDQDLQSLSYFHVPGFSPLHLFSPAHLDVHLARFIAIVKAAPKPIYVHCRAGVDRSGVLVAAYRVLIEGASREDAVAEMARFHSPWQHFDARYILGLSADRRQKILAAAADWESRLRPDARIDCAQGHCAWLPSIDESTSSR